jgi:hypothetical protein
MVVVVVVDRLRVTVVMVDWVVVLAVLPAVVVPRLMLSVTLGLGGLECLVTQRLRFINKGVHNA